MSNIEKAIEVIAEARRTAPRVRDMQDHISPHIAQALADAGLLAPDLPEPESDIKGGLAYWNEETVHCQVGSGRVRIWNEDSRLDSAEARELAYALLAAADYWEEPMSINITTTHTITCTDAPVEDVFKELQEKCPDANPRESQVRLLVETKAEIAHELNKARDEIDDLTRERDELQANVAELTRERDKAIIDSAVFAARGYELLASSRPALPEGMRIAEHSKYGRVVVSPVVDGDGDYKVFFIEESARCKADYEYANPSDLTFLDKEPAPAPLPKPEDCKAGELYLAKVLGREVVATRSGQLGSRYPWLVFYPGGDWVGARIDEQITLLARLLPDREEQA